MFQGETKSGACLKIQCGVVELGKSIGGEPYATETIESRTSLDVTPTLGELVPNDHPARFVAEFFDAFDRTDWIELGIGLDGEPLGAPACHPRVLLCVWLHSGC